jgi:hypothetical protein
VDDLLDRRGQHRAGAEGSDGGACEGGGCIIQGRACRVLQGVREGPGQAGRVVACLRGPERGCRGTPPTYPPRGPRRSPPSPRPRTGAGGAAWRRAPPRRWARAAAPVRVRWPGVWWGGWRNWRRGQQKVCK